MQEGVNRKEGDEYPLDEANSATVPKSEMKWDLALHQKDNTISAEDFKAPSYPLFREWLATAVLMPLSWFQMVCFKEGRVHLTSAPGMQIPWKLFRKPANGFFGATGAFS